jgi:hypothetical protein
VRSTVVSTNVSTLVPRAARADQTRVSVNNAPANDVPANDRVDGSNVVAFPRRPARDEPNLRGSLAWSQDVVAVDRRLAFAAVDARKRLNRLVRETLARPVFVADGAGYERLTAVAARDLLADPCVAFGPEEHKLLASINRYEAAQLEWERTRKRLSVSCGLEAILSAREELRDDATEAYTLLRCNGIDPLHP